jgi:Spy/CpxP family protein refolding chaperone
MVGAQQDEGCRRKQGLLLAFALASLLLDGMEVRSNIQNESEVTMKRITLAIAVLAAVATGATAFAYASGHGYWRGRGECWGQGAGPAFGGEGSWQGPGRRQARMARYLGLSEEQSAKMQEARRKYGAQMKPLWDEVFQRRQEMRSLYANPQADESAIMAKEKEIGVLQQRLRDDMVQLMLEQRKILTPEQLKKLADLRARFGGWRRG